MRDGALHRAVHIGRFLSCPLEGGFTPEAGSSRFSGLSEPSLGCQKAGRAVKVTALSLLRPGLALNCLDEMGFGLTSAWQVRNDAF